MSQSELRIRPPKVVFIFGASNVTSPTKRHSKITTHFEGLVSQGRPVGIFAMMMMMMMRLAGAGKPFFEQIGSRSSADLDLTPIALWLWYRGGRVLGVSEYGALGIFLRPYMITWFSSFWNSPAAPPLQGPFPSFLQIGHNCVWGPTLERI